MTPEQFAYWLQGMTECMPKEVSPSIEQWTAIRDHLNTVFKKVTPPIGKTFDEMFPNPVPMPIAIPPAYPLTRDSFGVPYTPLVNPLGGPTIIC